MSKDASVVSRSWTSRANLLTVVDGVERLLIHLPNPTLRGDGPVELDTDETKDELSNVQFNSALGNLVDFFEVYPDQCKADADLDWLQVPVKDMDNTYIHVSIYTTGSQCRNCGRREHNPSEWCYDDDGCESFRNATPKVKRGKLDKSGVASQFGS